MTLTHSKIRYWLSWLIAAVILLLIVSFHDSIIDYCLRLHFEKTELTITNQGGRTFVNSQDESEWDRKQYKIAEELSTRPEAGPVRCYLRAFSSSSLLPNQELEVKLVNTSDRPAILRIFLSELDTITFIFRDQQGKVLNSYCCEDLHEKYFSSPLPPRYLRPNSSTTYRVYLSSVTPRQKCPPGLYSIEAVFHEYRTVPQDVTCSLLARSNRLPVRVK